MSGTTAHVTLSGHTSWDPAALLRPDLSALWPTPAGSALADVTTKVLPNHGFTGVLVTPSSVDRVTGAATAQPSENRGWTFALPPRGNLSEGDILVNARRPVLLVGTEMNDMQFSHTFTALRPDTDTDALWLWACLNTTAGTEVRAALAISSGSILERVDPTVLPIPNPTPTWAEVRPQVLALQQQSAAPLREMDKGQSWWRREELDPRGNWMQRLSGPNPDEFEQGETVGDLASEVRRGRKPRIAVEHPAAGYLPVTEARNLEGRPPRLYALPEDGVVATPGDVLIPTFRGAIGAALATENCVVGHSLLLVRPQDPSAAPQLVAALNSPTGQRQLRFRSTGITIPQLSVEGLRQFRIPGSHGGLDGNAAVRPTLSELLDRVLWP